jgi:choline dehydrogenase-like flavoprotein
MIIDGRTLEAGTELKADLCVVGGGAAGITLAMRLSQAGLSVILLESGGFKLKPETQALYQGESTGTIFPPDNNYLIASRLRYLGGTTNHWSGWCRPLDPEDFAAREWVERSGWPFDWEELEPFYRPACELVQVEPFDRDAHEVETGASLLANDSDFDVDFFHLSQPTRFGERYRRRLRRTEGVRTLLYSNVVEIVGNEDATRVERLEVATVEGAAFSVQARGYVLAAGGVENARLLLASRGVQAAGLGNGSDMVGRCFMEHPLLRVGKLVTARHGILETTFSAASRAAADRVRGLVRPKSALQERHRLLNSLVILWRTPGKNLPELAGPVSGLSRDVAAFAAADPEPDRAGAGAHIGIASEQVPSPANRVRLVEEADSLGMPRVRLDSHLGRQEIESVRQTAELFARAVGESLQGRVFLEPDGELPWDQAVGSSHHMGTTRMSTQAKDGVVDANCRSHQVSNLWIAGSSVFPTVGSSNPTLTIVAMTLRLADHLTEELKT